MIDDPDQQGPPAAAALTATASLSHPDRLGDFTTDARLLIITPMAAVVGVISAFVAVALVWLIGTLTNLFYYQRFSSEMVSPAGNQLGPWAVLVPMAGGLLVGLMARYGSEKIRGHGIPEAMEAILIGRSRMSAKVALLKPLSSAISIGSGGPFGAEGPIIMTGAREHPTRLLGYLGRKGIAEAWEDLREKDQVREAGWLTSRTRLLRSKVRRVLTDTR